MDQACIHRTTRLHFRMFGPVSYRQPIVFYLFIFNLLHFQHLQYYIIYKGISDIKKQKLCLIEEEAFILLSV